MFQGWIETTCSRYGFQRDCFQLSSLALEEEGSEVWLWCATVLRLSVRLQPFGDS